MAEKISEKKYNDLSKSLKENAEIMDGTFKNNGIELKTFSINVDEDYGVALFFEISSTNSTSISKDLYLKVNSYDEDEEIIDISHAAIFEDEFQGYDTKAIYINQKNYLKRVAKCKVYLTT